MSSFQGVGIEEFHCIQRCPHFRGLSSTVYRGVLISGCWNRGFPLYTEVSSFQGVGIEGFHCIQRCPHWYKSRAVLYDYILFFIVSGTTL